MTPKEKKHAEDVRDLNSSVMHLAIYAVLLLTYFFLVLRFLAGWLMELFKEHRSEYAIVAIMLMIIQASGLETVSYWILRLIRGRKE